MPILAAQAAVSAADAPRPPPLVDGPELDSRVASPHNTELHEAEELEELEQLDDETPRSTSRKRILVASGIVAALIVGLVVGTQLTKPEADPSTSVASSAEAAPESLPIAAAEIFELVQQPSDVPAQYLPATFVNESLRALVTEREFGTPRGVFAARSTSNMICILVLLPGEKYTSNCTVESEFPTTGLRAYWVEDADIEVDGEPSMTDTLDLSAIWKADGTFNVSATGR